MKPSSILLCLLPCALAPAQGLYLGPERPARPYRPTVSRRPAPAAGVELTSLQVEAKIQDGVASTELRQVFHNGGARAAEGVWILPLPRGATVDLFTMKMNGREVAGEVLDAKRARGIFERIVRRRRDPGLLEYLGSGCLRARIFPIPPGSEIQVRVRTRQVLPATAGLHEWRFPLRATTGRGRHTARKISVDLRIESKKPIKNVFSPLPLVEVTRTGEHRARVSLEAGPGQLPDRDLRVVYGLSEKEFGLDLLTHRLQGAPGWFLMLLAPKQNWDESEEINKAITFVLDTSGSMQGKKISQARAALRFFLRSLKQNDRFEIVPFSTEARPFFGRLVAASKTNIKKALARIAKIEARGGTNIQDGLERSLAMSPRQDDHLVSMTVFLTDGMPTVGLTDVDVLLADLRRRNRARHRIFVFGVGDDVNTRLLDRIADDSGGTHDYVREQDSIELETSALLTRLSHPVLTDITLEIEGIQTSAVSPAHMPDLFKGSRLVVLGRYEGSGSHAIRLTGKVRGERRQLVYEGSFPEQATAHDFVPSLWAQRRIGVLLDAIRLHGQKNELLSELRRLGKKYGLVTPYTAHLILEEGMRLGGGARWGGGLRGGHYFGPGDRVPRPSGPSTPGPSGPASRGAAEPAVPEPVMQAKRRLAHLGKRTTGKGAVEDSTRVRALRRSQVVFMGGAKHGHAPSSPIGITRLTRRVKDHTFYLVKGVWIDAAYRASLASKIHRVKAFSKAYFALLVAHPELEPFFALAKRVRVVLDSLVIEVTA